jgi:hypothetical protein
MDRNFFFSSKRDEHYIIILVDCFINCNHRELARQSEIINHPLEIFNGSPGILKRFCAKNPAFNVYQNPLVYINIR